MEHKFKISEKRKEEIVRLLLDAKKCYGTPGNFQSNYKIVIKRCEKNENGKMVPVEHEYMCLSNNQSCHELNGYLIPIAYKIKSDNTHLTVPGDMSKGGAYERMILYMVVGRNYIEYITDHHFCLHHVNKDGSYYIYTVRHGYILHGENHKNKNEQWKNDIWTVCDEEFRVH